MNARRNEEIDAELWEKIESLREVAPRDSHRIVRGREHFLAEARQLASVNAASAQRSSGANPSLGLFPSLMQRIGSSFRSSARGNRFSLAPVLIAVLVALVLLFAGTGASVYAAQGSLPSQALYPLKLLSEDMRLRLASDPQEKIDLALAFANRRLAEIEALQAGGGAIPQGVANRLQVEQKFALQLAAGMEGMALQQTLEQIRASLQQQMQVMSRLIENNPETTDPTLVQVQVMLQEQTRLVQIGLEDPGAFQAQFHQRGGTGWLETPTPTSTQRPLEVSPEPLVTPMPENNTKPMGTPAHAGQDQTPGTGTGPAQGPGPGDTTPMQNGPGPTAAKHSTQEPGSDGSGPKMNTPVPQGGSGGQGPENSGSNPPPKNGSAGGGTGGNQAPSGQSPSAGENSVGKSSGNGSVGRP